jgi:histidinol-phosphatase (PHP family)
MRKNCKEIYPSRQLLQLAFQKGVPITFGSDAHAPEEVGMGFAEAIRLAWEVGYRERCRFAARKREWVGI